MAVKSHGEISVNGVLVGNGPYRTHREVLNAFGIHVRSHFTGAYPLCENVTIWFPNCEAGNHHAFINTIADDGLEIHEMPSPDNDRIEAMGVGTLLDHARRITFAKQQGQYYYVGVYEMVSTNEGLQNVYHRIGESINMQIDLQIRY